LIPTDTFKIIVKTHAGLEQVLADEIKSLGVNSPEILKRAVACEGTEALLYQINYKCSCALKVLKVINEFKFGNNEEFYKKINDINWEIYLNENGSLAIDALATHSIFNNTQFIARFTKDAIADRFRSRFNTRPNVDFDKPDLRINIHIHNDFCTVSLDSSDISLHKRGYRTINVEAPINEVTAAGLIRLTNWQKDMPFFDPMCGSGTLLIEAAMYAINIPAGYYRSYFGFMKWKNYDADLFDKIKLDADANIVEFEHQIYGADVLKKNIRIANENIRFAKLQLDIELRQSDFIESIPPFKNGILLFNPPYGERLEINNPIEFFKNIGNTLKRNYPGNIAWVFAQDNLALKHIGLRPSKKITLFNGKLECKLLKFELFAGKKYL